MIGTGKFPKSLLGPARKAKKNEAPKVPVKKGKK